MPEVLVLGATGFIGGHIALAALDRGWTVRGLRRRPGARGQLTEADIKWFDGNIDHPESLAPAFEGAEIVFHAAGYVPRRSRNVPIQVQHAVKQTRNVLRSASRAGVQRLVFTSSLTTIGHPPEGEVRLANESDPYLPGSVARSAYYECKYAMESEMLRVAAQGLPVIVVNPTAVFGPGDVHLSLGGILLTIARGRMVVWISAEVNVVDVRDVAQAQIQATETGGVGERYILGGHNSTMRELTSLAAEIAGQRKPRFELPLIWIDLLVGLGNLIPPLDLMGNHLRTVRQWQGYDTSKAQQVLSLQPRPLEETLRDALDWYRLHGYLG